MNHPVDKNQTQTCNLNLNAKCGRPLGKVRMDVENQEILKF